MKDKILNGVILLLVVGCLIIGGKIGYSYYLGVCEEYNNSIINFSLEVVKGNKTLEDISLLDASDSVKENLISYYNDSFYTDKDVYVLYDDISYYLANKSRVAEIQEDYGDSILDEGSTYFLGSVSEDDTDADKKFFELSMQYIDILKDKKDIRVYEENNKFYIKISSLTFDSNGQEIIYHNGFRFIVREESLEKDFIGFRQQSDIYKNLVEKKRIEDDLGYFVVFSNDFGSEIIITYTEKLGKINDLFIKEII